MLLVRQVLNALPLSLYIPGVSAYRATLNDQVAILMSTIAPPPSDIALRMAMFSSWDVPVPKALAGTVMNTLTFYIVRFGAPVLGFVLLAATGRTGRACWLGRPGQHRDRRCDPGGRAARRAQRAARAPGGYDGGAALAAGSAGASTRRPGPRPCVQFRVDVAARFWRGFPRSLLALSAMLAVDLTMLRDHVSAVRRRRARARWRLVEIAIAYLFAYPFTLFPFSGIGIVDALVLAAVVEAGGVGSRGRCASPDWWSGGCSRSAVPLRAQVPSGWPHGDALPERRATSQ